MTQKIEHGSQPISRETVLHCLLLLVFILSFEVPAFYDQEKRGKKQFLLFLASVFQMALSSGNPFTPQIPSLLHPPKLVISKPETPFSTSTKYPKIPSVSISASATIRHAPLPWFCCRASSSSSVDYSMPSSTKIIIKGCIFQSKSL